jgi:hypothetical protein
VTPAEEKIEQLARGIREQHAVQPTFFSTEEVVLKRDGQVFWRGVVWVYDIVGHERATRAYAWTYPDGEVERAIAVLGVPPIDSATKAAEAALVALYRGKTTS